MNLIHKEDYMDMYRRWYASLRVSHTHEDTHRIDRSNDVKDGMGRSIEYSFMWGGQRYVRTNLNADEGYTDNVYYTEEY